MTISFPEGPLVYDGDQLALIFTAQADGEAVECLITAEALEDHCGAKSAREPDLRAAFESHRGAIEKAAARLIEETQAAAVKLHSGYLRMYGSK
ncbi:DUF1488 family protein [Paraburkholderia acidisoli]|uniref:DUF1488 family protein n=1 Tax=Paraburkholderia acidisoli TaxID=2571748 RepID=A0A7Z2JI54_9BURK|nr:DUF1488 domain-containing protein [Paraburkholderia acidisoli]QGZ65346.1 DUF1488 family protein [Paraburkholderia acidisoli]